MISTMQPQGKGAGRLQEAEDKDVCCDILCSVHDREGAAVKP